MRGGNDRQSQGDALGAGCGHNRHVCQHADTSHVNSVKFNTNRQIMDPINSGAYLTAESKVKGCAAPHRPRSLTCAAGRRRLRCNSHPCRARKLPLLLISARDIFNSNFPSAVRPERMAHTDGLDQHMGGGAPPTCEDLCRATSDELMRQMIASDDLETSTPERVRVKGCNSSHGWPATSGH